MSWGFQWVADPVTELSNGMDRYGGLVKAAMEAIAIHYAQEIEDWMKANASWEDETGQAREKLYAEVVTTVKGVTELVVGHGADYGRYLEFSNGGKFAIVTVAIDHFIPRIGNALSIQFGSGY